MKNFANLTNMVALFAVALICSLQTTQADDAPSPSDQQPTVVKKVDIVQRGNYIVSPVIKLVRGAETSPREALLLSNDETHVILDSAKVQSGFKLDTLTNGYQVVGVYVASNPGESEQHRWLKLTEEPNGEYLPTSAEENYQFGTNGGVIKIILKKVS